MRLPKFRYALLVGGLPGLVTPIAVLIYLSWRNILFPPGWVFVVWPSLIMFFGIDDHGYPLAPLCLALITNVLIYVFIAASIWCLAWVIRGWRDSLRDGTTI
jgi:hypothetical protein